MKTSQLGLIFLAILFSGKAMSVVLFDDDFDEPDITSSHLNFAGLDNWTITDGTVDAFVNGGFGLTCPSAGCVDLDGSTSNAVTMNTNTSFDFLASEIYRVELSVSGNQRSSAFDDNDALSVKLTGIGIGADYPPLEWDSPFGVLEAIRFTGFSGSSTIELSHAGGDNVGIILDRITLCTVPSVDSECDDAPPGVPAPGTLALLGLGLAGIRYKWRKQIKAA